MIKAETFRRIRAGRGLTQQDIADLAGVCRATVCKFENDDDNRVLRLIEAYGPEGEAAIYGYELRDIQFARQLMSEGISPEELREHRHDFEWCAKILSKSYEKSLHEAILGCRIEESLRSLK